MYRKFWKRAIDITLSVLAIIVLSWLYLITALLIKLTSKGPVLFKQERIGKDGKVFKVLKFRSMRVGAEKSGVYSDKKDPRVTPVGRFIRATSIDELPQLFNILAGQMSFVGPRPALWNQEDLIAERSKNGSDRCVPGLTGWAQIHGRDELEISEKAALDGWYADHCSFLTDFLCLWGTAFAVLKEDGVREGKKDA